MMNLADSSRAGTVAYRARAKRNALLRAFLLQVRRTRGGPLRIVDLGGGIAYWERVGLDWLAEHDMTVACINSRPSELVRDSAGRSTIETIVGDACNLDQFADNSFDVAHSNSVIEHVGGWKQAEAFARETRRLAPAYYVQTPYFWFPFDPHFYRAPMIHWLPLSLRVKVHRRVKAGWAVPDGSLDQAMYLAQSNEMLDRAQFRELFPDADHRFEFAFGLPKSMIATRPA